jgi:hypothetical protein
MAPKCARSNGLEKWREKWGENIRVRVRFSCFGKIGL